MSAARKVYIKVIRCQKKRLRFQSYGGHAGARRLRRDRDAEDADLIILNTLPISVRRRREVYSGLAACA